MEQKNLKTLVEYTQRIMNGDTEAVYDYFAPEFFTHVAERVAPEVLGLDVRFGEVMFWQNSANAFPDRAFTIEKAWEIEGEEIVIANWTMTGTHTGGSYFGVPPSGKKVEINGTAILRFKEGKIVEHWGGPHCMHGIGLCSDVEPPTKISAADFKANARAAT